MKTLLGIFLRLEHRWAGNTEFPCGFRLRLAARLAKFFCDGGEFAGFNNAVFHRSQLPVLRRIAYFFLAPIRWCA